MVNVHAKDYFGPGVLCIYVIAHFTRNFLRGNARAGKLIVEIAVLESNFQFWGTDDI